MNIDINKNLKPSSITQSTTTVTINKNDNGNFAEELKTLSSQETKTEQEPGKNNKIESNQNSTNNAQKAQNANSAKQANTEVETTEKNSKTDVPVVKVKIEPETENEAQVVAKSDNIKTEIAEPQPDKKYAPERNHIDANKETLELFETVEQLTKTEKKNDIDKNKEIVDVIKPEIEPKNEKEIIIKPDVQIIEQEEEKNTEVNEKVQEQKPKDIVQVKDIAVEPAKTPEQPVIFEQPKEVTNIQTKKDFKVNPKDITKDIVPETEKKIEKSEIKADIEITDNKIEKTKEVEQKLENEFVDKQIAPTKNEIELKPAIEEPREQIIKLKTENKPLPEIMPEEKIVKNMQEENHEVVIDKPAENQNVENKVQVIKKDNVKQGKIINDEKKEVEEKKAIEKTPIKIQKETSVPVNTKNPVDRDTKTVKKDEKQIEPETKIATNEVITGLQNVVKEIKKLNLTNEKQELEVQKTPINTDKKEKKKEDENLIDNNMNIQEAHEKLTPQMNANMNFNSDTQKFSEFVSPKKKDELKSTAEDLAEEQAILSTMNENIAIANQNLIQNQQKADKSEPKRVVKATEPVVLTPLAAIFEDEPEEIVTQSKTKTVTTTEGVKKVDKKTNVTVETVVKYDTVIVDKADADFIAQLVDKGEVDIHSVQNAQKATHVSKTLADMLAKAMQDNKPIRIDFDNNISVIIKISKDGKISADFLPSSQVAESYLKENLPVLKQKLDDNNIEYDELNQRKQRQGNQENRKKGRKDE